MRWRSGCALKERLGFRLDQEMRAVALKDQIDWAEGLVRVSASRQ